MSKIEYDSTISVTLTNYSIILENKISKVCSRIGFDDSKITWIIFDPDKRKIGGVFGQMEIGYCGRDYGHSYPKTNTIWISTLSIMKDVDASPFKKFNQLKLPQPKKEDFLANVIIDEITHIQTKSNHGSEKYDLKYQENKARYYNSLIGQVTLKW